MEKGYVQVYTGNGKGKTTAALGLAFRAVGRGFQVQMFQFLKGTSTGELESAKRLEPNFQIRRFMEVEKFFWQLNGEEKNRMKEKINQEYQEMKDFISKGSCDVIILDEIMGAIHSGMVTVEQVCQIIDAKPETVELILTGRDVPREILERADLVTEMKPLKHYIEKGVTARIGIEK